MQSSKILVLVVCLAGVYGRSNGHAAQFCDDLDQFSADITGSLIVQDSSDTVYSTAVQQYAYTSFPERHTPSLVVTPVDTDDIVATLQYAHKCDYKVSVRSGGHQYSGLSSCDSSYHQCIMMDMSLFNSTSIDGTAVKLEPAVNLGGLYSSLAANSLFLPAGQCGTVNIGGHVQTGGYGHITRGYGLLADHVDAFTIVLSNGDVRRVTKPGSGRKCDNNDDLYYAVLGGGAGNWGVITEYELTAHRDEDSATSTAHICYWMYSADTLTALLKEFAALVDEGYGDNQQVGAMFTMLKRNPYNTDVIQLEAVWHGVDGEAYDSTFFDRLIAASPVEGKCRTIPTAMSALIDDYLTFELDAEFPFPFTKRMIHTPVNIETELITEYVSAWDNLVNEAEYIGVFAANQIALGGGKAGVVGEDTAFPYRDSLMGFVTDLFYHSDLNPSAQTLADAWLEEAWKAFFSTPTFVEGDRRMYWATFGDLDMDNVHGNYYPDEEVYNRLRRIKGTVDKRDLFSANAFSLSSQ